MKAYLIALICVCAAISELAGANSISESWSLYKRQHGKLYDAQEDAMRLANFLATKQQVERHNANSNATYKMRLNHMADWTSEEYQQLNGFKFSEAQDSFKRANSRLSAELSKLLEGPIPKEMDWRKQPNRVTPVKDQKRCGSCWAFATTGLLEGQQAVRNFSKLISLSEQELIDCSSTNNGCEGGFMLYALDDIAQYVGGIESEQDYVYNGVYDVCKYDTSKKVMTTNGGDLLKIGDEKALLKTVANYGPVAVAFKVNNKFLHYSSGVFIDPTCDQKAPNHAALVVGYGTDAKGGDYWIVKNSWNENWGEEGYVRMKRGVNQCGIAEFATVADF